MATTDFPNQIRDKNTDART